MSEQEPNHPSTTRGSIILWLRTLFRKRFRTHNVSFHKTNDILSNQQETPRSNSWPLPKFRTSPIYLNCSLQTIGWYKTSVPLKSANKVLAFQDTVDQQVVGKKRYSRKFLQMTTTQKINRLTVNQSIPPLWAKRGIYFHPFL